MIAKKKSFEITVELTDVYRKKKTTRHIMNRVLYCALVHTRQMGTMVILALFCQALGAVAGQFQR